VVFSEDALDLLLALPKRRQRQIVQTARQLGEDPFREGDYTLPDESGREITHVLAGDLVFAYWVDHAVAEVRIVEIDDVS
jgi:mRNA-degrading endonuclease RelE of RelBE toxin-antitoxin system